MSLKKRVISFSLLLATVGLGLATATPAYAEKCDPRDDVCVGGPTCDDPTGQTCGNDGKQDACGQAMTWCALGCAFSGPGAALCIATCDAKYVVCEKYSN